MKRFAPLLFVATIAFFVSLSFSQPPSALAQTKPTLSFTEQPTPTHGPLPAGINEVQAAGTWTVIHAQNFEGAFPSTGWSVTDLSNDGYQRFWDDSNYRYHLGAWAAWPARGGANGFFPSVSNDNYFDNMNTRMVYGPFSLADATYADTDFFLSLQTEANYDYLAFEVSHDGINFQEKARWSGSATAWTFKDTFYSDYVGDSSVWVAWRFYSDTSINYDGAWIDDIRIWKYVNTATPTRTLSPTITKTRTKSATPTITKTRTKSPTPTISPTRTKSATVTKTRTPTKTSTRTITPTPTKSATRTKTATITKTFTPKPTRTRTKTATRCSICTSTPTKTRTKTLTPTQTKTRTPSITPTKTLTPTPTGYRRYDAVNYAHDWVHGRNSAYPLLPPEIGNETGCDCDNCTNFMSQVLYAGGRPFIGTIGFDWTEYWWYDTSTNTSSQTWHFIPVFLEHASAQDQSDEFDVIGPTTDAYPPANIQAGDFLLLDLIRNGTNVEEPDGKPDHVRVIVGQGWTSTNVIDYYAKCDENGNPPPTPTAVAVPPSVFDLLIDQHCIDRQNVLWNYGILDNARKWYIHVK